MRNDTMKQKHWKILLQKINLKKGYNDLLVSDFWAHDILRYEKAVNEVLTLAQGEGVLEDMLNEIKSYWQGFELDIVQYGTKCKLIRGWDDLFLRVDEDLGKLASMKLSPHYKTFEGEINPWNDRLQNIRITFDLWIDVQKRWIYLEGIFFGSEEIKVQLTSDYNRFKDIDNQFVSLMKKVSAKPQILEVIKDSALQKTLERLTDSLEKIQKALTTYLETQRQAFARFYFIGDEDLLEIIGNSKDVYQIQKHFSKMFAGIASLTHENNGKDLLGMNSKEAEEVKFNSAVKIDENPKIDVWLTRLEDMMKNSLAVLLENAVIELAANSHDISTIEKFEPVRKVIEVYPSQDGLLATQIVWTNLVEENLEKFQNKGLLNVVNFTQQFLSYLADSVLNDLEPTLRKKYEQLITEIVHQRDVAKLLHEGNVNSHKEFAYNYYMRFYFNPKEKDDLQKLQIKMGNAFFYYGFEYLGMTEKLVQTPLTDKCYLTLTQAMSLRMGGSPFGPAGTGKTESVKALGCQLGRFVLVFNCDENFNFKAMGRIFIGLCQVGAWGCFDEFNRLEEKILSSVSQQILTIQIGLREKTARILLMDKDVRLNPKMGIYITMNPSYAGRSNLPENLKQLFRQMAMVKPDSNLIAQVMLFAQGFQSAETLSGKVVSLFSLCFDQLSSQPHYDFGLRSLKSVLNSAGTVKRKDAQRDSETVEGFEIRII
jgi:dynein heavy chain 1